MKRNLPVAGIMALTFAISAMLTPPASATEAGAPAGVTLVAKGAVWASDSNSQKRQLERKSNIYESDELGTGAESNAQFRMKDGATFSLGENTSLKITEYRLAASGDASDSAAMDLVEGSLRFVSGAIGKENHDDWVLKAGEASIGIRGTEGEVSNKSGAITVTIFKGRIAILSPECPETQIGRGTKFNFLRLDESGCSASYVDSPFSELPPEVFEVTPIDRESTEGGGGGGGPEGPVSPS